MTHVPGISSVCRMSCNIYIKLDTLQINYFSAVKRLPAADHHKGAAPDTLSRRPVDLKYLREECLPHFP